MFDILPPDRCETTICHKCPTESRRIENLNITQTKALDPLIISQKKSEMVKGKQS